MSQIRTIGTTLFLAASLLASLDSASALDPSRDKILYVVGDAHLDTEWNWTIQDTINSYIPATLHTNFAFFARYPHYTFSFEGAFRYALAKEYYPADFATLSNYVAQGRWHVAGSAWDAGDVNIPSPESLIRHVLYGNEFWKREFGKTSDDLFLPDCFGFGYALPSVGAHCGLKGFSSCRVSSDLVIPQPFQNIGRWVGPDGSSLVAVISPGWYSSSISANLATSTDYNNRISNMYAASGLYLDYAYFGTGDQGGGPTDASVNWLEQSVATTNGLINVISTGSDQLFRDLTPPQINQLPTYQGELLGTLGPGSYTTHPEMKQYNRENEQRGDAAERASVMADWLQGGGTYPQERLTGAWQRFLWAQFHDVISGTAIPEAYTFVWNDELLALNEFGSEETRAAGVLARALDTTSYGVPLVVYNPLSIAREDLVEATVNFTNGVPPAVRVFDGKGVEVPSQMGTPAGNSVPVIFLADVPATGAAVYDVWAAANPCPIHTGLSVSTSQLENSRYRVQLNTNGDVASIFDKRNNRELLGSPIRWDFLYDTGGSAWQISYNSVAAPPIACLGGPATVQVLEPGPARVSLAVIRHHAGSTFTERLRLGAGDAGDRLEWDLSVRWNTRNTLMKVEFPLAVSNPYATYDLGLGTIQRTNDTSSLYEVPAQQWADLTSADGSYGVTVMDDSKTGWDKPNNNTLRLTLFHDPLMGSSYPYQATNGFGTHRLSFAVMGHTNDWRAGGSSWVAARLNQPLQAFQTLPHGGFLGKSFCFLACDNSNVMVKALKKAENSPEIIVRLQELSGRAQTAQLSFATPVLTARNVTGAEDPLSTLSPSGGNLSVSLGAYQPMTLAITLAPPASLVDKPASAVVNLPFNVDAISTDGNRTDGNFDAGYTYPAELMPPTIIRDGVTFQLGPTNDGAPNALACQGQTIALNAAGYDQLYFLAAAASDMTAATFTFNPGTNGATVTVPYFSGFIGQWCPPAVLTNQDVAWVCTHRHTGGGANDAYRFCYLFKFHISLPPNASSVVLPDAPNLRIFAMSLATNTTPETAPAGGPLDRKLSPWANAGAAQTVNAAATNGTATVTLTGAGSLDPDGVITSYAWSMNGNLLATGVNPVLNLPIGTNTILLTVTDNQGQTAVDETTVVVLPPLLVTLAATPTNGPAAPLTVQFNGQASGGSLFDSTDDHQGTIAAQGENSGSGEVATNAFDDVTGTKWLDFANAYPGTRSSWIQYQYANGAKYTVTAYSITTANDATTYPGRNPTNWRLLGSNDGGASWDALDTETNQTLTGDFQKFSYNFANTTAYNGYRFQIDKVADPSAGCLQLDELEFLASPPPYSYWWSFGDGTTSTAQNPQHTYTNNGTYTVIFSASAGINTGTNSVKVTVGPPLSALAAASPATGASPLAIQFTALAAGGRTNPPPFDTTDNHLGTVTAQGENNGINGNWEVATNAFDDITGTKWLDLATNYPGTRSSWIQYQYPNGRRWAVCQYTITSANDATTYSARNPADWRLLGSNNGGATWSILDFQTNQSFTANFQTLLFAITNAIPYNTYRFQIDRVADPSQATCMQLDELQFLAPSPPYTYWWSFGDGSTSAVQNPQHSYTNNGTYTAVLVVSDGLSAATNTVLVTVAPPTLWARPAGVGILGVAWPAWASNYNLYSATSLVPPVTWTLVTNAVTALNGSNGLTAPIDAASRFYQLRNP